MAYTDIDKPEDYFNTVLYTGNGSTQSITGVGFQPDWVWIKGRSTAYSHILHDVVRGATKELKSNSQGAEGTDANGLTSFDSDGFSLGTGGAVNNNTTTFVSWNWLAGGTASSNTDGSITSNVSANTDAGFSIVSYTGTGSAATVGHGLSSTPKMVIVKNRDDGATEWEVYHTSIATADGKSLALDKTDAVFTRGTPSWDISEFSTSVFGLGTNTVTNSSGDDFIAYCFAEKKGYSKFGSYTGNGNADGTFVYTGFKPAWVMIKRTNTSGDAWVLFDNKRPGYNLIDNFLEADASGAEAVNNPNQRIDTVSNGFKCRGTGGATNVSGSTYIYMAFAENPFVTSTGIPCTAR